MATSKTKLDDERLIAEHVELDSGRRGFGDARLRGSKVPVWAIVGYLRAVTDPVQTAKEYNIPIDEVRAAQAYYRKYDREIDDRLRRTGTAGLGGGPLPRP
ncbi:MAG: DUF433 domain-containing protein [Chloroflexota bacterium]|nr:MAG: DUF433 domain-containing protein [Chloroflexota bacterium]